MSTFEERPETLPSTTYKLRIPNITEAFYITISDMILNDGRAQPRELFINTKNMKDLAWITTITRLVSTIFRNCEDPQVAVDELQAIHDPEGGFWMDGKYIPSISTAIGNIIHSHITKLKRIDGSIPQEQVLVNTPEPQPAMERLMERVTKIEDETNIYKNATFCPKCNEKALINEGGCQRCLSCDYDKCGGK